MNKKMREILAKIHEKTAEAKKLMSGEEKNVEQATVLLDEVDELKKEYEAEKRIFEAEKETGAEGANGKIPTDPEQQPKKTALEKFADDARAGFPYDKAVNEGTPSEGGYTVPEDIITLIESRRSAKASLLNLVRVENVSTNKGQRTFKKRTQQTGFTRVGEGGKIGSTLR